MAKIIIEYEAHEFLDHETQHVFDNVPFQTAQAVKVLLASSYRESKAKAEPYCHGPVGIICERDCDDLCSYWRC